MKEKQILFIGLFLAGILLLYFFIWTSFNHRIINLRSEISHNQQLLIWMQSSDQRIHTLEKLLKKHDSSSTASLLGIVQKQLKTSPIATQVSTLQQTDTHSVHLGFQKVNFDDLITWLTQLWQQEGIFIPQINITAN